MKATSFKDAPSPKPSPTKSRIKNGKCVQTDKVPYRKEAAIKLSEKWQADERGKWEAYKCPYGKRHWHLGHKRP